MERSRDTENLRHPSAEIAVEQILLHFHLLTADPATAAWRCCSPTDLFLDAPVMLRVLPHQAVVAI